MNNNKKVALVVSGVALLAVFGMFVGMGGMLSQTTRDLGVALTESTTDTVIAQDASTEESADAMAEKANGAVAEAFGSGATDADSLIAYETALAGSNYAEPLGESVTVWAGRSQTLASVVAMEVVGIGALAFTVGFIAIRMVKRATS